MKIFINYLNESINPNSMTEEEQIEFVKQDLENIKNIDNPTENVQLAAINNDSLAIYYIKNPSLEAQLEAIKKNAWSIECIKNPSLEVQLVAVKQDIHIIEDIENPRKEVQQYAAENIDFHELLKFIDNNIINHIQEKIKDYITKEIYYKAPKNFPWIPEIKNKFKDIDRFKRFNL